MRKIILIITVLSVLTSCGDLKETSYLSTPETNTPNNSIETSSHPGKRLMETNCYACHHPNTPHENRIAPPMIAIKKHYISDNTSKEEFVEAIQSWIKNPNAEDSKMPGAVRRFGVMPRTSYPEETIMHIAEYMYSNEIEQPEWFNEHFKKRGGKNRNSGGNHQQR